MDAPRNVVYIAHAVDNEGEKMFRSKRCKVLVVLHQIAWDKEYYAGKREKEIVH